MAIFQTKTNAIIFLIISMLLITQLAFSSETDVDGKGHGSLKSRSRFLDKIVKKGTRCEGARRHVCDGVRANKGKSLLYCCKKHCRNILGDRNNCGRCGRKCPYGHRCCGGRCIDVRFNRRNCGKCNKKCRRGVACDMGYCGYAN